MAEAPALLENVLREGLGVAKTPDACVMVIFSASGDLASRKLLPALYNLALNRYLPGGFSVLGASTTQWSDEEFRKHARQAVEANSRTKPIDNNVWQSFAEGLFYLPMNFEDQNAYPALGKRLTEIDSTRGTAGNRVFYMATYPRLYMEIARRLQAAGIVPKERKGWMRVVAEKPFGHDLKSARELTREGHKVFDEKEVFRIDHYLGKETVQNVLVFRFANGIFEPIWNRRYVDHVQITVAKDIGIERRGKYYENAGALRDIFQNHLLQLLCIVAMEPPANFQAEVVRDEKIKVLRSVRETDIRHEVVRGQYGPGWVAGKEVPGYRQEQDVAPNSLTESYVALRLSIDNWRWADTPFYLRTGKRLPKRASEIAIQFKNAPHTPFAKSVVQSLSPNALVMRIQPHEGTSLKIAAKIPGPTMRMRTVNMDFFYGSSFLVESPDAYERLILDCMLGDATLFAREDEVERAWVLTDKIEEEWRQEAAPDFPNYAAGTWGPEAADALMERDGRRWRRP
jgi:glucose-6-phosphate 1-dehydrogenase